MTCAEARQAILVAELRELLAQGDSTLAVHIRGCQRCRKAAEAVVAEEEILSAGLTSLVAVPDADRVLELALDSLPASAHGRASGLGPTHRRAGPAPLRWLSPLRRSSAWIALPVVAAAGLAWLFLAGPPPLPGPSYVPSAQAPGMAAEVPPGQNVAVLKTPDPTITVLWIF